MSWAVVLLVLLFNVCLIPAVLLTALWVKSRVKYVVPEVSYVIV